MTIWILKASEPTPYDAQQTGSRPFRYGMLARRAVERGHQVLWWTDDFDHAHKRHRFGADTLIEAYPGCSIQFVHTPGYQRNASLRRFRDHAILARRIEEMAEHHAAPDLILAGMPSERVCVTAVHLGQRYSVPVVLDVRDLWPDVFYELIPDVLRPALRLGMVPLLRRVKWAFSRADAVIGNTRPFVEWGLEKAGRTATPLDRAFPVGRPKTLLDEEQIRRGQAFWSSVGVTPGVFTICFFGAMGPMYDFRTIIEAAGAMKGDAVPVRFVLCGKGALLENLRHEARNLDNVLFPGWVNAEQIAALMQMSHVGLAPYIDAPNFRDNLPNKPAEYLSAALPILISVRGQMYDMVTAYECGRYYASAHDLAAAIRTYRDSPGLRERESGNAKRAFEQRLDEETIYKGFVSHLESIRETVRG